MGERQLIQGVLYSMEQKGETCYVLVRGAYVVCNVQVYVCV